MSEEKKSSSPRCPDEALPYVDRKKRKMERGRGEEGEAWSAEGFVVVEKFRESGGFRDRGREREDMERVWKRGEGREGTC